MQRREKSSSAGPPGPVVVVRSGPAGSLSIQEGNNTKGFVTLRSPPPVRGVIGPGWIFDHHESYEGATLLLHNRR